MTTGTIPARPPQARKPNFSEFEVEVDQRLWAKHTERSNKPTNPVAGPNTSITTGPGASKDAWSAQFSPSVSAPVRGHRMCDDLVDPPGCQRRKGRPLPAVTPLHPTLTAAILAPLSALDKPGTLYVFDILADQPTRHTCHTLTQVQIRMAKIGHSKHPWKRRAQWLWKCWGQRQDWWAYWNVWASDDSCPPGRK
ncbi:hypothetical protein B0H10DRAFT_2241976 [Mycena sp. CBHHK59/15]|nr:hypothetical protein B0H10DRAFT_2241976 [Mycena sp. CBHHK59/15]